MRVSSPLVVLPAAVGLALAVATADARAAGEALLLVEADTGKVLKAENATHPWYPASVTKLMTAYVTLRAVKEGRITLDSVFTVSPNAVAQQPTKMGFATGTQITVDNALKMMMVKSANDIAVVLAEGVSGSVEAFADEMNAASARLGMTQSSWVNPNGLPADGQITSARDMAILARAVLRELPEYEGYWGIPAIRFGKRIIRNTNSLLVRYPGVDGMKTGFICASGFNVVATATRDDRRLIAVVFGARSSAVRAAKAAFLFENAFTNTGLGWLAPSYGNVASLAPIAAEPPNLREEMCGKHRRRPAAEDADDDEIAGVPGSAGTGEPGGVQALLFPGARTAGTKASALVAQTIAVGPPIDVHVGPPRRGGAALASTGAGRIVPPAKPDAGAAAPATATKPAGPKPAPKGLVALPQRGPTAGAVPAPPPKPRVVAPKPAVAPKPVIAPKPAGTAAATPVDAKPVTAKPATPKPIAAKPKPTAAATSPAATSGDKPKPTGSAPKSAAAGSAAAPPKPAAARPVASPAAKSTDGGDKSSSTRTQ
ncbi:serine hydrolase [Rhodoplanes sp. SY1]|uniref:D-alanyl-D-alanine carboxypeptidase family protein n=1 Tax=Rhodoplanes sp. SY1 TaxID=3166646 RepID=UPI0038B5F6F6